MNNTIIRDGLDLVGKELYDFLNRELPLLEPKNWWSRLVSPNGVAGVIWTKKGVE